MNFEMVITACALDDFACDYKMSQSYALLDLCLGKKIANQFKCETIVGGGIVESNEVARKPKDIINISRIRPPSYNSHERKAHRRHS